MEIGTQVWKIQKSLEHIWGHRRYVAARSRDPSLSSSLTACLVILLKDQVPAVTFWPLCLGQSILTVNAGCDTNHFHCPVGQCRVFCMWFEELEYLPVLYHKIQPLQIQRDIRVAVPVFEVQVLRIRTWSETENLYTAKFEKVQVRKLRLKPFL